jgi:uncharacterized protein YkwD
MRKLIFPRWSSGRITTRLINHPVHPREKFPVIIATIEALETRRLLSGAFPTAFEQYVLELINRARANPGAEVTRLSGSTWGDDPSQVPGSAFPAPQTPSLNEGLPAGTIADTPEPPLAFNADLTLTAQTYSSTLLGDDSPLTHTFNGTSPTSRVQANGYNGQAGENLAVIANSAALPISESAATQLHDNLFIDSNVTGRGHRLNILNTTSGYQEIGIGLAASTHYTALGSATPNAVMLTEDFGVPTNTNPILTGVAFADANKNNVYDPGEGLGNVTITATRTSDNAVFSTTTWAAGGYSLQLAPGTYSVTASGDDIGSPAASMVTLSSQNVESDFTATKTSGGPQLTSALSGALPAAAVSGTKTTAKQTLVITNHSGGVISQTATIQLFLSPDATLDNAAVRVGSLLKTHLKLKANGTQAISLPLKNFPTVANGNYFVLAQFTSGATVGVAASGSKINLAAPFVNLSDSVTVVSPSAKPGSKAVITVTVKNSGNINAQRPLQIALSASTDPAGANPQSLPSQTKSIHIAPGGQSVLRLSVPIPAALVPDSYFIVATVDPNNTFNESNPNDNTAVSGNELKVQ